jgi:hypothetical protein
MIRILIQGKTPISQRNPIKMRYLAEVEDALNKLGMDSFKLMYLINKEDDKDERGNTRWQDDKGSSLSETTPTQINVPEWYTSRMRFLITLSDTTPETYMEDLIGHVNQVIEVINLNTPGVMLIAPSHKSNPSKKDLLSELSEDPMDAIRYLYGFKAGTGRAGSQYFRINLAIPMHFSAEDVVKLNKNSIMIPRQQSLLQAHSQSINPTTIGWLLWSNNTMVDFQDLEKILQALWTVKGCFGLYWAVIRDGDKYDPTTSARAIHIKTKDDAMQLNDLI